jgi:hypothetical protein
MQIDDALVSELQEIYEEVMWLANRPRVSPSAARAWYTHIMSGKIVRRMRRFSGKVSLAAVVGVEETLRLEHFERIQTTLTSLVTRHLKTEINDSSEFIEILLRCEKVHIVTFRENYLVMSAKGNYDVAGVELVEWEAIPLERRAELWKRMLRGRVSNAVEFRSK